MKGKFLLLFILAIFIGCKEEDMSPIQGELNKAILEKYIWKNDVLVDEVFTDNSSPERYTKSTTLSFTSTQYTYKVEHGFKDTKANLKSSDANQVRISEYWGDFQFNPIDSTLILSYTLNNNIHLAWKPDGDSLIVHTKYKVLNLADDELTIKLDKDSLGHGFNPIMTFKPVK